MIIPDVISLPGTALGVVLAGVNQFASASADQLLLTHPFAPTIFESIGGAIGGAGILFAVWWLYLKLRGREGLGLGDVKLLAMIGTTFGLHCAWFTIFIGSVLGSIIGILLGILSKKGLSHPIPFGPYLVVAVTAYILDFPSIYLMFRDNELPLHWGIFLE